MRHGLRLEDLGRVLRALATVLDRAEAARRSRIEVWLLNHAGPDDGDGMDDDAARRTAAELAVTEADKSVQRARLAIKHPQPVLRTAEEHATYAAAPHSTKRSPTVP